ncbi:MAG TPA: HAD hydrolase family protein [Anaerolineae bacterium]|jgi:soluble P-type ATPase|nr:HAD hydrolase family protein [Anaerolineae bacterium]
MKVKAVNIDIPGRGAYQLSNLILDMNGTIAVDGIIPDKILDRMRVLSESLHVYIITADTHGRLDSQRDKIPATIEKVFPPGEGLQKADFLERIGASSSVAIGNGSNDAEMLKKAKLGIAVIGREGCARDALNAADIVVNNPGDALDLLINTKRLIASLRR